MSVPRSSRYYSHSLPSVQKSLKFDQTAPLSPHLQDFLRRYVVMCLVMVLL